MNLRCWLGHAEGQVTVKQPGWKQSPSLVNGKIVEQEQWYRGYQFIKCRRCSKRLFYSAYGPTEIEARLIRIEERLAKTE